MIFFSSDTHFNHSNIIKFCNRPFSSVGEMNEVLIDNWNSKVKRGDVVYHLGDFAFDNNPARFFDKLNGHKFLIAGNHDKKEVKKLPWAGVSDYKEVKVEKQKIILSHYRHAVWNGSHHGSWHLFGHQHCQGFESENLSFDVGVDGWNYSPISFDQVCAKIEYKKSKFFKDEKVKHESLLGENIEANKMFW